jgi:uncharacterized protein (DUF1330 family)
MPHMTLRLFASAAALALSAGALPPTAFADDADTAAPARSVTLSYQEGQLITISSTINRAGDEAAGARREYFQRVLPIAQELGLQRGVSLSTIATVTGNFEPGGFAFFSWPSATAEAALNSHPEWPDIKALRPVAWDELRLYSVALQEDVELVFAEDRAYSVAVAWIDPEHPESYEDYLDAIEPALHDMGARFLFKMRGPRFEQHATPGEAPAQVTFVEWRRPEDLQAFLEGDAFEAASYLLTEGVNRFEVHLISPVINTN